MKTSAFINGVNKRQNYNETYALNATKKQTIYLHACMRAKDR